MATKWRFSPLLFVVMLLLAACSTQPSPTMTANPATPPEATSIAVQTVLPSPEPTISSTPTALPRKTDLASVMPMPDESLNWPMATGLYFYVKTEYSENESHSRLYSSSEDGRIATDIQVWCGREPYPPLYIEKEGNAWGPIEEHPVIGEATGVYYRYGSTGTYNVRFLQGNCHIDLTSQNYNNLDPLYEMARMISQRLDYFDDAGELVFPTEAEPMEELRGDRYRELFVHITPFIQLNDNSFMAAMDSKAPFLNHVTLGVYDLTSQKFISKTDLLGYPFLSPSAINASTTYKAVPETHYQLWVWVEDELIFVDELLWEGWQGPKP